MATAQSRACNPFNQCGHNEVGCETNEDCVNGHACIKATNTCQDIDECLTNDGLTYCNMNTNCTNHLGSFSCSCQSGYHNFIPNNGCTDFDECIDHGSNTCKTATEACQNTEGDLYVRFLNDFKFFALKMIHKKYSFIKRLMCACLISPARCHYLSRLAYFL